MHLRPILSKLAWLPLLGAAALVVLHRAGCSRVVMVTHALKTVLTRAEPDYDRLEAHRRAQEESGAPSSQGAPSGAPGTWSTFRGPLSAGAAPPEPLLATWPDEGPALLWRQPVGGGYASCVVAHGRAVTLEQRRAHEAVVAYDLETGTELWSHAYPAHFSEPLGGEGPRATPLIADDAVVALGATGELTCLDLASGALRWRRNVLGDGAEGNLTYGLSASPILYTTDDADAQGGPTDPVLFVLTGAPGSTSCVHAFSLASGTPLWSALPDRGAYATPILTWIAGREQLIVASATRVVGLDPGDGELLWEYPWSVQGGLMISQPLVLERDRILLSAGYGAGAALVQVASTDGALEARTLWRNTRLKAKFNSAVAHGDHVYGLDEGTLVCLEIETGRRVWKGGRFGYGQLLLADGALLVVSESGELARVRATPAGYEEQCRFDAIEGTTWNVPALAGGRLLVRNAVEMACFDLRPR